MIWCLLIMKTPSDNQDAGAAAISSALREGSKRRRLDALGQPLEVFQIVWNWEKIGLSSVDYWRDDFPDLLESQHERIGSFGKGAFRSRNSSYAGDKATAFDCYIATLSVLLTVWRREQPTIAVYGSPVAHWCDQHPVLFSRIAAAMAKRAKVATIETGGWDLLDFNPDGGPALVKGNKHLILAVQERFVSAISYKEAAENAAYTLFGDFLFGNPHSIVFCTRCEKPFERRKKKRFCSGKCGRRHSSVRNRKAKIAVERLEHLPDAVRILGEWLQKPNRDGWRISTEHALNLGFSRRSRLMGAFIAASSKPLGSPERLKIFDSLSVGLKDPLKDPTELEALRDRLEAFLSNIAKAEDVMKVRNSCSVKPSLRRI